MKTLINQYQGNAMAHPFYPADGCEGGNTYELTIKVYEYAVDCHSSAVGGQRHTSTEVSTGKMFLWNGIEYGPEFFKEI